MSSFNIPEFPLSRCNEKEAMLDYIELSNMNCLELKKIMLAAKAVIFFIGKRGSVVIAILLPARSELGMTKS
jgi:hypothetical protein